VTIHIEQLEVDESAFPEMRAVVSVVNSSQVPIEGLTEDNFEVYEGGQPLPVTAVQVVTDTKPSLAVALVLDLSSSSPIEEAKAAANWLLDSLEPNDRVALIGFNQAPELGTFDPAKEVDFTTNKELVRDVIDGFDESDLVGISAVYQAIDKGVSITAQQKADRRAVVVVTDGYQYPVDASQKDEPKTRAVDERIPIFTIGVYNPPDYLNDRGYLEELARDTGGKYQEATDPSDLTGLFQNIVGQLWVKYQLTFSNPDLPRDDKDHVLTFQVAAPAGNDTVNRTVTYPPPPPRPQILKIQQDINGELQELQAELRRKVLLVPQISAQNPTVRVEYFLDGQLAHAVMVDVQESQGKHEPWEWKLDTCEASTGAHTLTVIAYDDLDQASDQFSTPVNIVRSGICLPGLGSVDTSVVVLIAAGVLLLLLILVGLILASRRRGPEMAPQPIFSGPPTVPSAPSPFAPGPPGPSVTPPPSLTAPPVQPTPGYTPTVQVQPAPGAPPVGRRAERTEAIYLEPAAMAWLIAQTGPLAGREFRLGEATSIGRTGENDIVLDDGSVSRQHARVKLEDKLFFLYDLGATNTTKVNGQEIARHQLRDGDRVEIGRITLVFKQIESGQN